MKVYTVPHDQFIEPPRKEPGRPARIDKLFDGGLYGKLTDTIFL